MKIKAHGPNHKASTNRTQTTIQRTILNVQKIILGKEVHKDNSLTDWNNSLKTIWVSDSQRLPIYSNDHGGHYWDGRYSVQERSR